MDKYSHPTVSVWDATLKNMGKRIIWIHNIKTEHSETVCIYGGIYISYMDGE